MPTTLSSKAAAAFIALAKGDAAAVVPWDDSVAYYIGSERTTELTSRTLPQAMRTCPAGDKEYEGRKCPVSPLETVARSASDGSGVVVEPTAPTTVGCTKVTVPTAAAGLQVAAIRPAEKNRDCFGDYAVTLFTDSRGAVKVVQFTLSSP